MKFHIATDHAGIELKNFTKELLEAKGHEVVDHGPYNTDRVDYPDFAGKVCKELQEDKNAQGILICGSGIGISISANKYTGIIAALCHDAYTAQMAREHNNANILCFGERIVGKGVVESMIDAWLSAEFAGGRHTGRVEKILAIKG